MRIQKENGTQVAVLRKETSSEYLFEVWQYPREVFFQIDERTVRLTRAETKKLIKFLERKAKRGGR